jgi:hypothetical protein
MSVLHNSKRFLSNHDTSIVMLEPTYSRHITEHTDALTRRALLDLA